MPASHLSADPPVAEDTSPVTGSAAEDETVDRAAARWAVAAGSVAGASAGVFVGVVFGMKLHSGAARMRHRIASVHEAWETLRD